MDTNRLGLTLPELYFQSAIKTLKQLPRQQVTAALPTLKALAPLNASQRRLYAAAKLINEGVIRSDQ